MGIPPFKIEQSSQAKDGTDLWTWELHVAGSAPDLDRIQYVVYSLHTAFPNPNRMVRDRATAFRLRIVPGTPATDTWGTFAVRVRVVLKDAPTWRASVELELRRDGRPALPLLDLPAGASLADHLRLAKGLKAKGAFGYARAVLADAHGHPDYENDSALREKILQQEALCTYKDPLLPLDTRLADALTLLDGCAGGLEGSTDPETLGIAGAIHKRLWEVDAQRANLEWALRYYRRGYTAMTTAGQDRDGYDGGAYTGVNAAFVADLLQLEESAGQPGTPGGGPHAALALKLRHDLVDRLTKMPDPKTWWHHASLAEAHLGLARDDPAHYDAARASISTAMSLPNDDWERESTATQLTALVELHARLYGPAANERDWNVVATLVPENAGALRRPVRGKVGIALSGGGFRASLYHIGVLARLAELDLLREVEVLSCVSGGSIIGAHYYLELRRLLQTTSDAQVTRQQYVELVSRVADDFLTGVQKNVRVSVAASLEANWRMLLSPNKYSRTRRIGELYEEYLFRAVDDGENARPRWLNDIFVCPHKSDGTLDTDFSPKLHNWRRRAKVPILVLNATTLNTGRGWQFTASSMGEPPSYGSGIDATERYAPVYYSEAPEEHREIRLGHAVAASSCVPGLFDPLVLDGLYDGRTVRLVDGGVHDNQGTRALVDQDCTVLLVSDASGQMDSLADPSNAAFGVVLRTNTVLQARLRVAQHQEIHARRRSHLLREEMLVHLKLGLEASDVLAHGVRPDAAGVTVGEPPGETPYGIRCDMQAALARIRTDLDSFTDREAYALMTSGYRAAKCVLANSATFGKLVDQPAGWKFLALEPALHENGATAAGVEPESLLHHLRVGSQLAFKVWSLHWALRTLGIAFLVALAGGVLYLAFTWPTTTIPFKVNWLKILVSVAVVTVGLYSKAAGRATSFVMRWLDLRGAAKRIGAGFVMGTIGFLLARLHLRVFDAWFRRLGRVDIPPGVQAAAPSSVSTAPVGTTIGVP